MHDMEIQCPSSLFTARLSQPPSCLQFLPNEPAYLVIGTYLLSEETEDDTVVAQRKTGSLQLWYLDTEQETLVQINDARIDLPYAVFDLKFHPWKKHLLGVAGSNASVSLYSVSPGTEYPAFKLLWKIDAHENSDRGALFLAWTPRDWLPCAGDQDEEGFALTFADGRTSVFTTQQHSMEGSSPDDLQQASFIPRESIETWFIALESYTTAVGGERTSYMFTGNDFGALQTRRFSHQQVEDAGDMSLEERQILFLDDQARHHTAGVTSILPLPLSSLVRDAPILLTGSYDEYLRVYHATPPRGKILAEQRLGGGVWRLNLLSSRVASDDRAIETRLVILASCMHAGARVVEIVWRSATTEDVGEWTIRVLAQFTEHESMNYASDVYRPGDQGNGSIFVVSSSFYDKRLCLWKVDIS